MTRRSRTGAASAGRALATPPASAQAQGGLGRQVTAAWTLIVEAAEKTAAATHALQLREEKRQRTKQVPGAGQDQPPDGHNDHHRARRSHALAVTPDGIAASIAEGGPAVDITTAHSTVRDDRPT